MTLSLRRSRGSRATSTAAALAAGISAWLGLAAWSLVGASAPAVAAPNLTAGPRPAAMFELVLPEAHIGEGRLSARQLVPDRDEALATGAAAVAQSRIIYLNKNGVTVKPASTNDARANKSTIVSQLTAIPAWTVDPQTWEDTVSCMRGMFAPFAVQVVTADPGSTPHLEAIFGGSSTLLGLPKGIVGISPFTTSCAVIENSMVYTFTEQLPPNARVVCEIMAQEIAHSYGLDHELLASDPMTYLAFDGERAFRDQLVACGESSPRPCGIGGSSCRAQQNSVQLLRERLGVADPEGPSSSFVAPVSGAIVGSEFEIAVAAVDNVGIASVEFFVDDVAIGGRTAPPFSLIARNVSPGPHTLAVQVMDPARNLSRDEISILVEPDPDQHGLLTACAAGGRQGLGTLLLALAALALRTGRRRR